MTEGGGPLTFGARLRYHAAQRGEAVAVTVLRVDAPPQDFSWQELDRLVDRICNVLRTRGVTPDKVVGLGLRNGILHIATTLAVWRLGCTLMAFDPTLPEIQAKDSLGLADAVLAVIEDSATVGDFPSLSAQVLEREAALAPQTAMPDRVSRPGKIILSGGSTGLPKLMADDDPWIRYPGRPWGDIPPALGFASGQVQLVGGAMSHNAPLTWAQIGLFEGQKLIVLERFDAAAALRAIDEYAVEFAMMVPTMMVRMLDSAAMDTADLRSLKSLYHTGGPCPVWLKRAWIERLGADRVFEMYGSGENVGQTIIGGQEWLSHPGSVGRPFQTDVRILDSAGVVMTTGQVGEIYMRLWSVDCSVHYLDPARRPRSIEGFTSVGDMGWLDDDGYVYLAGRRDDVINTGGVKVHPEAIEAVLLAHPAVRDAVVIGLEDREWGQRVHAVVEPWDIAHPPLWDDLRQHCENLPRSAIPKGMSVVNTLPRDGFGKVKRAAVRRTIQSLLAEG